MTRKKVEFEMIQGTGAIGSIPLAPMHPVTDYGRRGPIMCPYTNYIPLSYLFLTPGMDNTRGLNNLYIKERIAMEGVMEKMYNTGMIWFVNQAYMYTYGSARPTRVTLDLFKQSLPYINRYLFYDESLYTTDQYRGHWWSTRRENIIQGIDSNFGHFNQRSYCGYVSPYSLYRDEASRYNYDNSKTFYPHVLAAIRPEHYMWLKINFLLTGKIDMSKLIIFIDKELDTTAFPVPAFRALYREIKPKLMETSAQIWRVPLQFIQDNCFLGKFDFKESNIFKRQEEIEKLVEEFYSTGIISEEELAELPDDEDDEDEEEGDDFEEDRDDDEYRDEEEYEEEIQDPEEGLSADARRGLIEQLAESTAISYTASYRYEPVLQVGQAGYELLSQALNQTPTSGDYSTVYTTQADLPDLPF